MASTIVLVGLGLWVILQTTHGPLAEKLGFIKAPTGQSGSTYQQLQPSPTLPGGLPPGIVHQLQPTPDPGVGAPPGAAQGIAPGVPLSPT